ncbi:hypothetical protein Bca4012_080118 [Brassica carinata]
MRNISITCRNSIDANTGPVTRWMTDAVRHNVVNLDIDVTAAGDVSLVPLEIFTCKTLVHLKLAKGRYCVLGKLLSACPFLEELTILGGYWQDLKCGRNVSSSTLKKLTMKCTGCFDYWDMSLDTPSLVYFEYSDLPPRKYQILNLESFVEAKLDLQATGGQGNPTNLIKGHYVNGVKQFQCSSTCLA